MESFRKAIKRIAAIGSGALIAASSFGVVGLAADLADYPAPFVKDGKWTGLIAVGSDAASGDVIGATDIAATLAQTVTGGAVTTKLTGGKEKELKLGNALNDPSNGFSDTLDNDDLAGFQDTTINIAIGDVEGDYDVHDELKVGNIGSAGPASIETGLTYKENQDEDFKEDAFMAVPKGSIGYYYVFDDPLKNGISDATPDNPIEIDFLGKKLIITGANADRDSITVQVGDDYFMNVGETVTVNGHTVKLLNVGSSGSVVVSVDGVQETISNTEKVNGLRIKVKDYFYADTTAERSATLTIGDYVTKTYNNGDAYIGEDKDDPNWVWDLADLNTAKPIIGVVWDQTYDDPDEVIKLGESLALPNNYATIKLEGYTVTDSKKYTIDIAKGEELYDENGTNVIVPSAKAIHFHADGNDKNGFKVGSHETDDIYLRYNSASNHTQIFWKDHNNANKIKYAGSTYDLLPGESGCNFSITYEDTTIPINGTASATNGTNLNLTIDEGTTNLKVYFEVSSGSFQYLGHSDGDTNTANDVMYGDKDISGWKENTRTQKGIVVHAPHASAASDKLIFDVPSDIDEFAVKVLISGTGTKVTTTGGAGSLATVPVAKLDTEIADPKAQNLILVGGPAVNKLTAQALGLTYPTYGEDAGKALGIAEGKATLKLVENAFGGTNTALIVAGWEVGDTRNAANVLKDYTTYKATLKGKQVIVTSTAGTITLSAPEVTSA